jgi:hypothetical protein
MLAPTLKQRDLIDLRDSVYGDLFNQVTDALLNNPVKHVWCPGWGNQKWVSAVEVIKDSFDGSDGEEILSDLLKINSRLATAKTPAAFEAAQIFAQAWIQQRANDHAEYHCDDAVKGE